MPTEMMIRRLRVNSQISENDALALRGLPSLIREVPEGRVFVHEGDRPTQCCVIMSGFVFRSKMTENGRRQILSFHPAGDMPDLHGLLLERMDHDLTTLSDARLAFIEHRHINKLIEARPAIGRALWRETLVDGAVFRQWIVNLGTRTAPARMAHLVAELRQRLSAVGLAADNEFEFPITQSELAEALGLSSVHVNRVIQSFRAAGVLEIKGNRVRLKDIERLVGIGGFNELYLHQQQEDERLRD
jgi:CRP-like cAMP-binding protein